MQTCVGPHAARGLLRAGRGAASLKWPHNPPKLRRVPWSGLGSRGDQVPPADPWAQRLPCVCASPDPDPCPPAGSWLRAGWGALTISHSRRACVKRFGGSPAVGWGPRPESGLGKNEADGSFSIALAALSGSGRAGLSRAWRKPRASPLLPRPCPGCAGPSSHQPFIPACTWGLLLQEVFLPFSLTAPEPAPV